MFAVVILGIGMIMTAAIFPVAISQTRSNVDETTAAAVGTSAVSILSKTFASEIVPSTDGSIVPLTGALRQKVYGNLISNTDARFAWVPLYRRNGAEPTAQVFVFVVRDRNRSLYQAGVDIPMNPDDITGSGATLDPAGVTVTLQDGGTTGPDLVTFENDDLSHAQARVAPGAFVLIAGPAAGSVGRIYRVGNLQDASTNTWQLVPGWDMQSAVEDLSGANAYIVGRGYADPTDASKGFDGPAQDIAVYTAFVPVK